MLPETKYSYKEIVLEENDIVIMMTDGVTEFRTHDEMNSRKVITSLILENKYLSAQQLCNLLYKQIEEIQDFKLSDDFTVVIIKNRVSTFVITGIKLIKYGGGVLYGYVDTL